MAQSGAERSRTWRAAHPVKAARGGPERSRAWRAANPEKQAESDRGRRVANSEKRAENSRAWRAANPEKQAALQREWGKANPEKNAAKSAFRKARKLQASPAWAGPAAIAKVYADAKLATSLTGVKHHVDHVVPLRSQLVCGLHVEHNLEALAHFANVSKGNRYWPDMPGTGSEVPPGAPPPNVTKILRQIRADLKALGYDKNGDKIA